MVQNAGRYGRQTGITIALGLSLGILLHSILSLTGASLLIREQPAYSPYCKLREAVTYFGWASVPSKEY